MFFFFIFFRGRRWYKIQKKGVTINKNIMSIFIMILIVMGIVMSVLNFGIRIYASQPVTIYGTITPGTTYLAGWWDLNGRYLYTLGGIRYYCVWDASNCCIVDP